MARARNIVRSSVHRSLNVIGDRWTQLIIEEAFRGGDRFEAFRERTGASRNTLSIRLRALVEAGVMTQLADDGRATREYRLTERGRDLFASVLSAWCWAIRWDEGRAAGPTSLIHTGCGKSMLPRMACTHCAGEISLHACSHQPGPGAGVERTTPPRMHRRRQGAEESGDTVADYLDLTGDRWTGMIISTQYFGIHRFEAIQSALDIATNILTDRLRALVAIGVFERRLYQISPPRYEYWLTKKGKDLYPHALTLLAWGDRWLLDTAGPPLVLTHIPCGRPLSWRLECSECAEPLATDNVTERWRRRTS